MRKDGENRGEKGRAKAGEKTKERGRGERVKESVK